MPRTIQNVPELSVIWDYLIEVGCKIYVDAPDCEYIHVQWRNQNEQGNHAALLLRLNSEEYSITLRSCIELAHLVRYPLVAELAKRLIKTRIENIIADEDDVDYPFAQHLKIKYSYLWVN